MLASVFRVMSATSKIKVNYSLTIFDLHSILHFTRKSTVHILHSFTTSCTLSFFQFILLVLSSVNFLIYDVPSFK